MQFLRERADGLAHIFPRKRGDAQLARRSQQRVAETDGVVVGIHRGLLESDGRVARTRVRLVRSPLFERGVAGENEVGGLRRFVEETGETDDRLHAAERACGVHRARKPVEDVRVAGEDGGNRAGAHIGQRLFPLAQRGGGNLLRAGLRIEDQPAGAVDGADERVEGVDRRHIEEAVGLRRGGARRR